MFSYQWRYHNRITHLLRYSHWYEKGRIKKKFEEAHRLHKEGKSKVKIADILHIRRPTIITWLSQEAYGEQRGWSAGSRRKYTSEEEQRIVTIKKEMIDRKAYFLGAPYVQMHYEEQQPKKRLPTEWFISDVVRTHGLQTREPKKRNKGQGIVERLKYPIHSIVKLGRIHQSVDYIGKKFITGRTEPISIFGASYYQWLKLYQIRRVLAETTESATRCLSTFWKTFPIPNVVRMDNGMTFRGTGRLDGRVGRFLKFLLNIGITPLFSAAYQSYTNPHIEGHNSTFTQKLWSQHRFTSTEEIDRECERFNAESKKFYFWKFKERLAQKSLRYFHDNQTVSSDVLHSTKGKKVCFIRFVQRWSEKDHQYGVVVLNRFVEVPSEYNNQYLFVELYLETATVHVRSERDGIVTEITRRPFPFSL